jgi:hypothetical protein
MHRLVILLLALCGAASGWSLCVLHWTRRPTYNMHEWQYMGVVFLFTIVCAGWPLFGNLRRLSIFAVCTGLGTFIGAFASTDMSRSSRIENLLTHPFDTFPPSGYGVGAVLGVSMALWLPEIRDALNRLNRK